MNRSIFRFLFSTILIFFFFELYSQEKQTNDSLYNLNRSKLDTLKSLSKDNTDFGARERKSLKELGYFFSATENFDQYLECLSLISYSFDRDSKSDSSLFYLKKGFDEVIHLKKSSNVKIINIFYNRYAALLNDSGKYKQSRDVYLEQLDHLRKNDTTELARAYNNFAVLLNNLKENEQSLRYYDSCIALLKDWGLDTSSQLAKVTYLNRAMPQMNMGHFQEALESIGKCEITLANLNMQDNPGEIILTSLYYAYVYSYKNEFPEDLENALYYANKGYKMLYSINKDHFYMTYFYLVLADIEEKKGNLAQSLAYNKKAVALKTKLHGSSNDDMPSMLTNLGRVSSNIGQKDSASYYFATIHQIYQKPGQIKTYDFIEYLFEHSEFHLKNKESSLAKTKLLQALKNYIPSYSWEEGIAGNPSLEFIPESYQSAFFFIKKGEITKKIAEQTNDTELLNSALDSYIIGIILLNKSKNAIFNLRSKSQYGQQKSIYFNDAIELAMTLYQKTNEKSYAEKIFLLTDLNKSSNLKHSLNQRSNNSTKNIPIALQVQELELKTEINFLEQKLYRDSFTKAVKPSTNDSTLQMIVKKKEEMNNLLSVYKKNHPNYYNFQYGDIDFSSKNLFSKSLINSLRATNKLIIQFHEYEDGILLSYLKGKKEGVYQIDKNSSLKHHLNVIIDYSRNLTAKEYQASAHYLYQKLIKPVLESVPSEGIIIIPDGRLNHLNFEVLITELIEKDHDFKNLNYLIKKHTVTYQYASSLIKSDKPALDRKKIGFMGFAPYQQNEKPTYLTLAERSGDMTLASFSPLPFSDLEVENISKKFSGKGFYGNDAKESHLKKEGLNTNILHFATHSHIDERNPIFSSLLLSPDDNEDGILYNHELFEMNFNADLVTLSACNSGNGELQQGEGVISLARGFMYANVPNVLMSLWAVSDQSTSKLMSLFYDKVYEGESYSEAIRNAKLDYLSQADENTAHPYYWAGFVFLGEVESNEPNYLYYFLFGIASLIALYFLYNKFILLFPKPND